MERVGDLLMTQEKQGGLDLESQRRRGVWGLSPEVGSIRRQGGPWAALPPHPLVPEFLPPAPLPRTPMNQLLADGAGLPGLSEPGVHTAAVIGCREA